MKQIFTLLVMLICTGAFAQTLTVRSVINRMIEDQQTPIQPGSVDTLIVGRWNQQVRGIATSFMATFDVIKRAHQRGLNLVLTHEPTFYNHLDERDDYGAMDPVVLEKLRFIEENDMVIFRYHDLPHQAAEDMINAGLVEELGWQELEEDDMVFRSPFKTLGELTGFLKNQFGASTLRVVGSRDMNIATIGILPGAYGRQGQVKAYNSQEIDVLIVGEAREWETIEYVRDAIDMGRKTALIVLGHADSEEPGMEYVANWLKQLVPEVPVEFVPAGNPVWGE